MSWPASTARGHSLAHGLFGRIQTRTNPARVYSSAIVKSSSESQSCSVCISVLCWAWSSPVPADGRDSCWPQHVLDSALGAVGGRDCVWRLKFLNNVDVSQLKEHIKNISPPFQCSCYSLWQNTSGQVLQAIEQPSLFLHSFVPGKKSQTKNISCMSQY